MNKNNSNILPFAIFIAGALIAGSILYKSSEGEKKIEIKEDSVEEITKQASIIESSVIPENGVVLPVSWGNLGVKLVGVGVIDADKMKDIYEKRSLFSDEYKKLLLGENNENLKITRNNAGYLLNLFWALGLANKNPILDSGEMMDTRFGGAKNFASTGGWSISKGDPMDYYSKYKFFDLTKEQQDLVDKMSKEIYRPCCGNSTHFPDCNHGMAMLGLLELMASQGASEKEMWEAALAVNSYWFPDAYITIAIYMKNRDIEWKDVDPKEILGKDYSSASGYAKIEEQVIPIDNSQDSNGGCSV